jgi:hypothetical protein
VVGAYEKKIADRFHRRIFMPAYRRFAGGARGGPMARHLAGADRGYDWIVVADSRSMPDAVLLLDTMGGSKPGVAYSIDHVQTGAAT